MVSHGAVPPPPLSAVQRSEVTSSSPLTSWQCTNLIWNAKWQSYSKLSAPFSSLSSLGHTPFRNLLLASKTKGPGTFQILFVSLCNPSFIILFNLGYHLVGYLMNLTMSDQKNNSGLCWFPVDVLPCDKDLHNFSVGEKGDFIVCTNPSWGQKSYRCWKAAISFPSYSKTGM